MAQLEPLKTEIEQAGAQLVYIAAEIGAGVWKPAKFLQSHPVSYPFLLDEDRSVTKAYGLYHRLGVDAINIAHPASLVIERDRRVEYIYRGDSQTDRAPFDQVLAAVKKLSVSG
jgi:peroxiredoxin